MPKSMENLSPLFANKNFLRLIFADLFLSFATSVLQVVIPWVIASHGNSYDLAIYGAVIAFSTLISVTIFAPLGDRYSKKMLLSVGLSLFFISAVMLMLALKRDAYMLNIIVALSSIMTILAMLLTPILNNLITDIVTFNSLGEGVRLQKVVQGIGKLVGPILCGAALAFDKAPMYLGVLFSGLAFLVSINIRPVKNQRRKESWSWWSDLKGGLALCWRIPLERWWNIVNFFSWIFLFPALSFFVPLKVVSLGLSGSWIAYFEVAIAIGVITGSLYSGNYLVEKLGRYRARLVAGVLQGVALALIGYSENWLIILLLFGVVGLTNATLILIGMTHRMLARPEEFRIRLSSAAMISSQVAAALGVSLAGCLVGYISLNWAYMLFGVFAAISTVSLICVPDARKFLSLSHAEVAGYYLRMYPKAFFGMKRP